MNWFLEFPIPSYPFPISHDSRVLSLGSCFADHIGDKLEKSRINALVNPLGIAFHPLAIMNHLSKAINGEAFEESGLLEKEDLFFHYLTHSEIKASSKQELIKLLNQKLHEIRTFLDRGTHLIITLGTAWVYELVDTSQIVANCHKQPSVRFKKRLLTLEEMEEESSALISRLQEKYPDLKLILTVSPVRHVKDGVPQNQLSKSLLRILSQRLCDQFEQVNYFPAYEIMMDELRDYRFYKIDKIHPTEEAVDHIWKKFIAAYTSKETQEKINNIQKIEREIQHRPLNPESSEYRRFLAQLEKKLERLDGEFDFSKQLSAIRNQLNQHT